MHKLKTGLILLLALAWSAVAMAHINPELSKPRSQDSPSDQVSFRENCDGSTTAIDMQINNVRARLWTAGDVWWDGTDDGRYVVPKPPPGVPEVSSIFAGAVWLGGKDPGGNLKVAAQTYGRDDGEFDFYSGPLNPGDPNYPGGPLADPRRGTVGRDTCAQWDKFFVVSGDNVDQHVRNWRRALADGRTELSESEIPEDVRGWPARGNRFFEGIHQFQLPNTTQGLAGFWDQPPANGIYEPHLGDYPIIEIRGCTEFEPISAPDEMIFWIYNDAGNDHRESGSPLKIQMEVQVQAFAYSTNDDINNMTFQRYKLINRAIERIDSTYFAMWVDPDLGCYTDDYVGCDVGRSLAYVYNADQLDGTNGCTCDQGVQGYCDEVPILGVDYFRGPLDEFGEELGMSSFTYYNNGAGTPTPPNGTTDPSTAEEYYNYLSGRWLDGEPFTEGGDARLDGDPIPYAFTDPPNDPNGWSMCQEGLPVGDRRTIQASGQFTLLPGAVNELIIGVVWVPDQVYPCPSISRLQKADDIAQDLFDACFRLTRGPDAPDVDWIELDREIVAVFTNDTLTSNNANEAYMEPGLGIPDGVDSLYRFEGYKLFQFSGPDVSLADVDDPSKVRLVYQVDKRNGISKIFNWETISPEDGETPTEDVYYIPELEVDGQNAGIRHTFRITEDQFSEGNRRLVNHRKYYFAAVAYAFNEYQEFAPEDDPEEMILRGSGQQTPYLEGDGNIGDGENSFYTVIPRQILDRNLNAMYGDGAIITRIDGVGNGGEFLDISDETRKELEELIRSEASDQFSGEIVYKGGFGPLDVSVFNPLDVIDGEYELTFIDDNMGNDQLDAPTYWTLKSLSDQSQPVITAERTIEDVNEQIIREYGFSVTVRQVDEPGENPLGTNGAVGFQQEYIGENPVDWLFGIEDELFVPSGFPTVDANIFDYVATKSTERDFAIDPNNALTSLAEGILPYYLADWDDKENDLPYLTPAWTEPSGNGIVRIQTDLADVNNIDIVLTSDKSLWSRCIVIETMNRFHEANGYTADGGRGHFDLRDHPSVSKDDADNDGLPDVETNPLPGEESGFGWFPGYAIDVETGQRLNIFFGENSMYNGSVDENLAMGADMMWNPTSDIVSGVEGAPNILYNYIAGGQHFVYVTNTPYDRCAYLATRFKPAISYTLKVAGVKQIQWAAFPILASGTQMRSYADGLIPSDVVLKMRVDNSYQVEEGTGEFNGYPTYRFTLDGKQATALDEVEIDEALQAINVVPNPYYGFSDYEDSQFETVVKVTNLPAECVVTIYSLEGKFIRQYNRNEVGSVPLSPNRAIERDQINPDLEWDLKNFKGIPVASGVYLIHVSAPGLGERTLKWFGVNRQFDPSGL